MRKGIEITVFNEKGIWFKNGKAYDEMIPPCSTHLRCRTLKKARRIARGILNRWPNAEVYILKDRREYESWILK